MTSLTKQQEDALKFWYKHLSSKSHSYDTYKDAAVYHKGGDMIKTMGYTISVTNLLQLKYYYDHQESAQQ